MCIMVIIVDINDIRSAYDAHAISLKLSYHLICLRIDNRSEESTEYARIVINTLPCFLCEDSPQLIFRDKTTGIITEAFSEDGLQPAIAMYAIKTYEFSNLSCGVVIRDIYTAHIENTESYHFISL